MSSNNYVHLRNVEKGRTDWKIKIRIIREWRGVSLTGEKFKGYNLLLLDAKNVRMVGYVPEWQSEKMQKLFTVGKMYTVTNFQVKQYNANDKWRCVNNDRQILFTNNTKAKQIDESEYFIPNNHFNFFEMEELTKLAKQNVYLADVVGVVIRRDNIRPVRNTKLGTDQMQVRMKMTDGKNKINVIFWDKFAEEFQQDIDSNQYEEPLILIIASGKVGVWKEETDICNFSPTAYYINYKHHSVQQLRKLVSQANFCQHINYSNSQPKKTLRLCTVAEIKNFNQDYILQEVVCQVKIKFVENNETWVYPRCTTCYKQIQFVEGNHICIRCKRRVPHPDKKFAICVLASDKTGDIEIILMDRPVRYAFGKNVFDVLQEYKGKFPTMLKSLENQDYTIKLQILEVNIQNKSEMYLATDMFKGFTFHQNSLDEETIVKPTEFSAEESSGSSYHLDNMSET
ncbi:hypothetical protein POM88_051842 [Heracleum sosnowskyi]|uniref:Replication protein A 70 kDa DNA-binding subunit B/D first OB fold domain-containing protein n=1 Tax=Heracleum sosnowskyi TaxID=360622 RepID=A0AAD8LYW8_9APIA|nr:hypothetical protein POM88_051842 [Heracleum sosnowskyi]